MNEEKNGCNHPQSLRKIRKRKIKGIEVELEICKQCGLSLVNPNDILKLLSKRGSDKEGLNPEEVILILLGSYPNRPIFTRILMMKEAFLLEKEVAKEIDLIIESLSYIPYDYGPYSKKIDDSLRTLHKNGFIKIELEAAGQKEIIGLTDKGKQIAVKIIDSIPQDHLIIIKKKRKAWDQLGYQGILRKVYEEYPAYKCKSKIGDKIKPGRRWT